jgi:hypothetical protein
MDSRVPQICQINNASPSECSNLNRKHITDRSARETFYCSNKDSRVPLNANPPRSVCEWRRHAGMTQPCTGGRPSVVGLLLLHAPFCQRTRTTAELCVNHDQGGGVEHKRRTRGTKRGSWLAGVLPESFCPCSAAYRYSIQPKKKRVANTTLAGHNALSLLGQPKNAHYYYNTNNPNEQRTMIEISRIPTSPILLRATLPPMINNISSLPVSKTDVVPPSPLRTRMLTSSGTSSTSNTRGVVLPLPLPPSTASSVVVNDVEPTRRRRRIPAAAVLVGAGTSSASSNSTTQHQPPPNKQVRFASRLVLDESPSTSSPLHRLDRDEPWQTLWYSYDELTSIKNEVHQTSHRLKRFIITTAANAANAQAAANAASSSSSSAAAQHQQHHPRRSHHETTTTTAAATVATACCSTPTTSMSPSLAISDVTRGLESRSCPERQRRKYLTIRYVLHVARSLQQSQHHHHPSQQHPSADTVVASRARICSQWATQLALAEAQCDYWRAYHDNDDDDNDDGDDSHGTIDEENYYQPQPASPKRRLVQHDDDGEKESSSSTGQQTKRMRH